MKLTFSHISNGKNFSDLSFSIETGQCAIFTDELFIGSKICETIHSLRWKLTAGEVRADGQLIHHLAPPELTYCSTQVVSKFSLKQLLTVEQFLSREAKKYQTEILVDTALSYFKLENLNQKRLYQLDKIELASVIVARLACCISSLWVIDLFDLPIGEKTRKCIYDMIQVRCMEGGTVILNSQDKMFRDLGENLLVSNYKYRQ